VEKIPHCIRDELTMAKTNIRSKIRWGIFGIFALLVISIIFVVPTQFNKAVDAINNTVHLGIPRVPESPFRLGLDLQGGAHLVYSADVNNIPDAERSVAVEGVRDVIERRVNAMGVGESQVQTNKVNDEYRLIIELPGIEDINEAITMIGETPILEFKVQNDEPARDLTQEEEQELKDYNADAKKRAENILKDIENPEDFSTRASEVSEDTTNKNNGGYVGFIPMNSNYPELYDWAKNAQDGDISNTLIESHDGFNILRRDGQRDGQKQVDVSHILICYLGSKSCDNPQYNKEEALAKAQEIYNQANADNFSSLAVEFSTDPTVSQNNGDLGFISQGQTVEAFEQAAFGAETGQIVGPVQTEFGYHIIYKKEERTTIDYELSRIFVATKSAEDIVPPQNEWKNSPLSGKHLERSEVVTDTQTSEVQVALNLNSEGKDLFAQITQEQLQKPVAIFLDGNIISAPVVQTVITDGRAVIRGGFSLAEARLLSQRLNAGALPVSIDLISQQTVGASLGAESLRASLYAGVVGVLLVMLFMLLYYRLPGLLSVIALSVYIALTLALFKLIGVTLTLAGIAGFILSIGMAVDANVLIFERLKEELRDGKSLKAAVEEGFNRAWTSIRDGNVSTLITCALLIWFGSSFVQGFAITLGIGVGLSMFSAITITRVMLRFVVPWFKTRDGGILFRGSHVSKK